MTQFNMPVDDFESTEEQKTSRLAIASLVCSLICCLPVTTIPGILLGVWAMVSINGNPARFRGKGLAVAGILLGVIFTAGQAYVIPKGIEFFGKSVKMVMGGPTDAMNSGFAGDATAFKSHFYGTGARASDAEAQAFIDTLRSRYGEFRSCEFDQENQPPTSFGQPDSAFAYVLTFENASVDCQTQIIWYDERTDTMVFQLGRITITDQDLGDLIYPAKTRPADAETESESESESEAETESESETDAMPESQPETPGPDEGNGG